jgi:hypothetical protein
LRAVGRARITRWGSSHALAEGLRSHDVQLDGALIFAPGPGDEVIAETEAGPVVVARETGGAKSVVFGFDPAAPALRNTLSVPLLFANALRWLTPDVFRGSEIRVAPPGLMETDVSGLREDQLEVASPENVNLPWSLTRDRLRLFAGRPGRVTVRSPLQQWEFDLTLPQVGSVDWEPPADVLRGVPPALQQPTVDGSRPWRWLALAGLLCLLTDWVLFGRRREDAQPSPATSESFRDDRIFAGLGEESTAKTDVRQVVR